MPHRPGRAWVWPSCGSRTRLAYPLPELPDRPTHMRNPCRNLELVASRQDVLEATTGCITKDVLEACALERAPLRGGPAGGFTSFRIEGLSFDSSSSRAWQAARSRLSWAGFRPR